MAYLAYLYFFNNREVLFSLFTNGLTRSVYAIETRGKNLSIFKQALGICETDELNDFIFKPNTYDKISKSSIFQSRTGEVFI